jgi:hypothetical protein
MVSALDLLHLARTAAAQAGGYLRRVERPSNPARWTLKGSRDFVTEVDRTAPPTFLHGFRPELTTSRLQRSNERFVGVSFRVAMGCEKYPPH